MAIVNINDEASPGVVLLDPATGKPTLPGGTSMSLEAALMLFVTKDQFASQYSKEPPNFAYIVPVEHACVTYVNYGQAVPLLKKEGKGEAISVSNNAITLQGGKTYKLKASLSSYYSWMTGAFIWAEVNAPMTPIGAIGGSNGSPWNWNNKGDAVAIVSPNAQMSIQLTSICPYSSMPLWGGNEWDYSNPTSSWITVEELK